MIALVAPLRVAVATLVSVVPRVLHWVVLSVVVWVVVCGVVVASPAEADGRAGSGVELSADRVTWGDDLDEQLFPPGPAWAAGDVRAATFFVRNDSGATADIEVTLTRSPPPDPAPDPAIGETVAVTAVAATDTSLPADGEPHVVTVEDLAPGDVAPVTVRAEVRADVPSGTAVGPGTIDYRATLSGAADDRPDDKPDTEPDVAADPEDDPAGILSAAHLALAPVFLGLGLVLATVAGRRRSRARGRRR